jgi:hypothetical protein
MLKFFLNILTAQESRSGGSTTFQSPEAVTVNDKVMRLDTCIGILKVTSSIRVHIRKENKSRIKIVKDSSKKQFKSERIIPHPTSLT